MPQDLKLLLGPPDRSCGCRVSSQTQTVAQHGGHREINTHPLRCCAQTACWSPSPMAEPNKKLGGGRAQRCILEPVLSTDQDGGDGKWDWGYKQRLSGIVTLTFKTLLLIVSI